METTNQEQLKEFTNHLNESKHLVILTGAGVSAESGISTYKGDGGYFRGHKVQDIATPEFFEKNPSLVWQFYQEKLNFLQNNKNRDDQPNINEGHKALAELEKKFKSEKLKKDNEEFDREFTLITTNLDGYHQLAGSKNVLEMHGRLNETRCTECNHVEPNNVKVDVNSKETIPIKELPHCNRNGCKGLLRPNVVWYNEPIDSVVYMKIENALEKCDFFIIVGSSNTVYPAAYFKEIVSRGYVPIAEFNTDDKPNSKINDDYSNYLYIKGRSSEKLAEFLLGKKPEI